jgi:hypothetical protein
MYPREKENMGVTCKGICVKYKAPKPPSNVGGRYGSGQKRCQVCELFIEWNSLWCPCCHFKLRAKPRHPESKKRFMRFNGKMSGRDLPVDIEPTANLNWRANIK